MPDIVPNDALPVNGPPVPNALQPIQGPPVPNDALPIQGPAVPPGTLVPPTVQLQDAPTGNQPTPALPVTDPMAVSRQAIGDAQAAQVDEQKAAVAQADAEKKKAEAEAAQAQKESDAIRKRQEDADRQQQANEQARGRLSALAEKADNDVANFRFSDYKDTIPVGSKIGLIIGAALAGLGGSSDPMAQINRNIAQHFDKEKAELSSKESFSRAKRQGVEDFDRHVNDQRMYLEFKERNYREAMAKETEAQGLRSGSPVAAAKAQQMAAKIRADGDAKLGSMVDQYTKGEEARAHAALFAAKARGGGKGGGKAAGADALADAAQAGATYADLVKIALKSGAKDPKKAAKDALEGVEKDQQTIFTDPETGQKFRAPSSRVVDKISQDMASSASYQDAVEAFASHIEKHGRILNPYSEEGKMRASLAADVQSKGRQVQGIQASDSGAKLEHDVIGGSGVGLERLADPNVLRRLAREAREKNDARLRGSLTPLPGRAAAPTSGAGKGVGEVVGGDKLGAPKTTSVSMPDGSVQVFDAAGKRVK